MIRRNFLILWDFLCFGYALFPRMSQSYREHSRRPTPTVSRSENAAAIKWPIRQANEAMPLVKEEDGSDMRHIVRRSPNSEPVSRYAVSAKAAAIASS